MKDDSIRFEDRRARTYLLWLTESLARLKALGEAAEPWTRALEADLRAIAQASDTSHSSGQDTPAAAGNAGQSPEPRTANTSPDDQRQATITVRSSQRHAV